MFIQLWCILKDTEEADVIDKTNATSRPLTICTYPEVCIAAILYPTNWMGSHTMNLHSC